MKPNLELAPEQYELHERAAQERAHYGERSDQSFRLDLRRRSFFQILGCGLLAICAEPLAQESGRRGRGNRGGQAPADVSAWIHIAEDGTITVYSGKTEVGQNVRTSLTQAAAEELRVPMSSIKILLADTELVPYDAGTFGSRSTPDMAPRIHRAAAAAREALIDLAAEHFKVDRASLTLGEGRISKAGGGESVTFGQLTKGQKLVRQVDNSVPITPPTEWKICGTSAPKVNAREIVTGRHEYSSDMKLPGMLFGKVLRPGSFGATLTALDTKGAEAIDGVIIAREGDFVGVAAADPLTAQRALDALRPEWKASPQPSHTELFEYLKKNANNPPAGLAAATEEGLAKASQTIKQTYTVAYIAHTPLEPRAALAEWKDDKMTIWTGTQRPFGVRSDVARAIGIPEEQVRVIVPDTGSGYGGKHTVEAATEAARLARASGKPVKIAWTREEEFNWAYARPAGVIDIAAGAANDGSVTAWEFHNYNSGGSSIRSPYHIPSQKTEFHGSKSPLKQGSYRALAATANTFARETAMDELAALLKMDPLEFRLKNLTEPRMRAVLEAAAQGIGWGKMKNSETRGFGLACGTEKASFVATCAEVAVDRASGDVRVVRAVTAFECGAVRNPDHLKNQVEGSVIMGLGGALFEAMTFENGRVTNPYLADYRVPRFSDAPRLETILLDRKDIPSAGGSETPIIAIAPAIGNAIFAATNIRLRSMPMVPNGLKT